MTFDLARFVNSAEAMRDLKGCSFAIATTLLWGCGSAAPSDPLLPWDYSQKSNDDGGTGAAQGPSGSGAPGSSAATGSGAPATSSGASGASGPGAGSTGSSGSTGHGGSGSSGAGGSSGASTRTGTVPCDVATVLAAKCTGCHADPPTNGALAGLVTYADLQATSMEDPTKNEAQAAVARMQNATSPMPPATFGNPATSSDIMTLQSWINAGYPAGSCGADAGPPPSGAVDVFATATAFSSQTGGNSHNPGRDCMQCHAGGGGEAPTFAFGGTLYDAKGNAVAGAEIRVIDANGKAISAYSGTNGNFHASGSVALPGHAGARDATGNALMISSLTYGGCNKCHCSGSGCTTPPLHLP